MGKISNIIGRIIAIMLIQWLIFDHLTIGTIGIPMVYIVCLITLPGTLPRWGEVIIASLIGFMMDISASSPGVHMAACTAIGFCRPYILSHSVQDLSRIHSAISGKVIGHTHFLICTVVLTLVHHIIVFGLESWSMQHIGYTLVQISVSSALTIALIEVYDFVNN